MICSILPANSFYRLNFGHKIICTRREEDPAANFGLEAPGLENILQAPGNRAEVDENYDARNGLSPILSVLNLSRAIFRP